MTSKVAPTIAEHKAAKAKIDAENQLRDYLRTGHPLFVWRAFATYRKAGLPVPANVLKKLDQWASRLESANDKPTVLEALELLQLGNKVKTAKQAQREADMGRIIAAAGALIERKVALINMRDRGEHLDAEAFAAAAETDETIFKRVALKFGKRGASGTVTTWKNLKLKYYEHAKLEASSKQRKLSGAWFPRQDS